jgi:ATP-binding cassette subfamily C protein CydD
VALSVAGSTSWLLFAVLAAMVVSQVFLHGKGVVASAGTLALMLGLVGLRAGLPYVSEVVAQRAATSVKTDLRERLASKLIALGPTFTRGERTGQLVYAAGEGAEALDGYLTRYWPARMLAGIVPVLVLGFVFVLDPWTVLVLAATWPVLLLLLALIGVRVRDATERRERELAWMSGHFLEVLRGLPTLKMFGRSTEQAQTIEDVSRRLSASTMDVLRTAFQSSLVLEWGATGATAFVAIEASVRLMSGGLPFDHALAVLLLAPEFFLPLRRFSLEYHAGKEGAAAASTIYALLDQPARSPTRPAAALEAPADPDLRFEKVHVAYEGGTRPALNDFSLEVRRGQTVALVGPTGSGKTTVANVLLRFVEPDAGSVTAGGTPLGAIDPGRWRARVAWVPQHPTLFHGTVADNIRLASPYATDEDVVAAARAAHAHDFVQRLPKGYATPIGEGGVRLSGGERQRVAIARAFLKNAPLLVLDEATSHLEDESRRHVLEALVRLVQGRTVLLITHQLDTIGRADLVAMMDAGRVAEVRRPEPAPQPGRPHGRFAAAAEGRE